MERLSLEVENGNDIEVSVIDKHNEIEIFLVRDDAYSWITKEQAKELIDFLQKQIEV